MYTKKEDRLRILEFELYCYRRILQLNWTQKITNAEVRERINSKLDMIGTIMKRKLQLFGHIQRMRDDRKLKSIMTGIIGGGKKEKAVQRVVAGHRRMVWDGYTRNYTQSKRQRNLEESSQVRSPHLRARSPRMMKKKNTCWVGVRKGIRP